MEKQITIIGVGPGSVEHLTSEALLAVRQAKLLIGARRLLESFDHPPEQKFEAILADEIAEIIQNSRYDQICVLMSGDPGFYSGTKRLYPFLKGHRVRVLCGIGSLQYLCAQIPIPWDDVFPVSAHGRKVNISALAAAHEKTFFLTGGGTTVQSLCCELTQNGLGNFLVTAGSRLSYPDERMVMGLASQLAEAEFDPLSAVLVQRTALPLWPYTTGGIPDNLFLRGTVPMTKEEVRAVTLSKLRVQKDDILYDIGAGTGSVSVEMALTAPMGQVYAIERNPEALDLIAQNRLKFGAFAIQIVAGSAPEVLEELPAPTAVFIGGSSGKLEPILRALMQKNPRVRVVINAVTVETLEKSLRLLSQLGFQGTQAVQLAVTRTECIGKSHLMRAQNPVFLISGQGAEI